MSAVERRKTVLITGCTPGGIGYALARAFHARGHVVIATARRLEVLEDLRRDGMIALPVDVTKSEEVELCRDKVAEITGGKLDVLINNAGQTHTIPAIDADMDEVRSTFETNVFGVMVMIKVFSKLLIAARGRIVNISSLASIVPYVYGSIFCATKGAINSYSRTLRQELRPFGVKVTVVMAGFVKTKTNKTYRELPNGSVYSVVADQFRRRLRYSENTSQMTPETFADILVGRLLKDESSIWGNLTRSLNWVWIGGSAALVKFVTNWVGEWLLDAVTYRKFELDKLEAIVNKSR
ncbi:uncharacterized protein BHQ10_003802 [Talaromyces amestolkiae]|uniref:Ketoreductase domain-containing protein n=1 Tax=Talaromyces amestolkiae TaxID=1196081 RepID=A0A364KW65_TALAM|nr:uncharacterized protein BHQ10_003802 [Talaromyces amestolkiae]RAO67790.1 hypothetical protein BHQ10_003802 [Talaromyces amestolkiae]